MVSVKRDFSAIRFEIIESLLHFLEERYRLDSERVKQLYPLKKLNTEVTDYELKKKCYEIIIPELDLASFALQYRDACDAFGHVNMAPIEIIKSIIQSGLLADHKELVTAFARIVAAKPHSADVERLIKSYNVIKTEDRANLSSITLKNDSYIRHNMPLVSEFEPRPYILTWLNDKERRDVLPKKSKEQRWFASMFKEAYEETKNKTTTQSEKVCF